MSARRWIRGCLSAGAAALALVACGGSDDDEGYVATALVTDVAGMQNPYSNSNTHVDPNLVNAWGIAFNPQGFVWVANTGTRRRRCTTATACRSRWWWRFHRARPATAEPTGIVFNGSSDFSVTRAGLTGASAIHLRRRGRHDLRLVAERRPRPTRSSWSTAPPQARSTRAWRSPAARRRDFLYAADFHNGRIDVFDADFQPGDDAGRASPTRTCRPASRRSASRRSATASTSAYAQAGRRRRGRRRRRRARRRRTCSTPRARCVRRLIAPAAAERAVGHGAGAGRLRPVQQRAAGRQFRRRQDQRLRSAHRQLTGHAARRERRRRSRSTGCGASRSATASTTSRPTPCSSPPGPTTRKHGVYGRIDLPLDAGPHERLSRSGGRARAAPAAASRARPSARPGRRRCAGARAAASRPASSPRRRPTPAGRRR